MGSGGSGGSGALRNLSGNRQTIPEQSQRKQWKTIATTGSIATHPDSALEGSFADLGRPHNRASNLLQIIKCYHNKAYFARTSGRAAPPAPPFLLHPAPRRRSGAEGRQYRNQGSTQ